jgi:hypothetical protein
MSSSLLQYRIPNESTLKKLIKREDSMDCAIYALEYIHAVTDPMADLLRSMAFRRGFYIPEILSILRYLSPHLSITRYDSDQPLDILNKYVLPGHAAIVGVYYRESQEGHMVLMGKRLSDHRLFLTDRDHFIVGEDPILKHLHETLRIQPALTFFLYRDRSNVTPSPKIRSELQEVAETLQTIRQHYTTSSLFSIPGLTEEKMKQLRTCKDIPSFLFVMKVIDSRFKRLLLSLPLSNTTYLTSLLKYQLGLLYEPTATTRARVKLSENNITLAFEEKILDKFWYVGRWKGKTGAIYPPHRRPVTTTTTVYVMTPNEAQEGQIR